MPNTSRKNRRRESTEAHFALAQRVLKGLHASIDADIERACDLEVEHALALYKAGKATLQDADEVMQQVRRRIG